MSGREIVTDEIAERLSHRVAPILIRDWRDRAVLQNGHHRDSGTGDVGKQHRDGNIVVEFEVFVLREHADTAPAHAVEQGCRDLRRALHGVVLASNPWLEPFERASVFGGHADQEVRVGADPAVGQMIVGEHDQDVGLCRDDGFGEIAVGRGDDVLDVGRGGLEQADQPWRMRCAGSEYDLCHDVLPFWSRLRDNCRPVNILQSVFLMGARRQRSNMIALCACGAVSPERGEM